jgi:hypothetical protein
VSIEHPTRNREYGQYAVAFAAELRECRAWNWVVVREYVSQARETWDSSLDWRMSVDILIESIGWKKGTRRERRGEGMREVIQ